MDIIRALRSGINSILHPDKGTKKKMGIGESLGMYYRFSIVPGILYVLFFGLRGWFSTAYSAPIGPDVVALSLAVGAAAIVWIVVPIILLVCALIFHVFARLFGLKGRYSNTLTAVVFLEMVGVSVAWLSAIPILGSIVALVAAVWGVWVFVCALANQHGTTKGRAFLVWLIPTLLILIIIGATVAALLTASGLLTGNVTAVGAP